MNTVLKWSSPDAYDAHIRWYYNLGYYKGMWHKKLITYWLDDIQWDWPKPIIYDWEKDDNGLCKE